MDKVLRWLDEGESSKFAQQQLALMCAPVYRMAGGPTKYFPARLAEMEAPTLHHCSSRGRRGGHHDLRCRLWNWQPIHPACAQGESMISAHL